MWDASNGTNPDTCQHRAITQAVASARFWICARCNATLDQSWVSEAEWFHDIDHNLWVFKSKRLTTGLTREQFEKLVGFRISDSEWEYVLERNRKGE